MPPKCNSKEIIMGKSVAIMGFSPVSMMEVYQSKADEIWMMNRAYEIDEVPRRPDNTLKCTRLFEIHKEDWYYRKGIQVYEDYWAWLQEPHDFQVVMQSMDPRVPSCWEYPYDAVCEDVFAHLWRKKGTEYIRETYLTSSFDIMVALAIHEGYTQIEPYGVEMDPTETEYAYQKPGGSFVLGVAVGRGIDVMLTENGCLCRGKVYGFEGVPAVTPAMIQFYIDQYENTNQNHLKAYQDATQAYNKDPSLFNFDEMQSKLAVYNTHRGALEIANRLISIKSDFLGRQQLEELANMMRMNLEKAQAGANLKVGKFHNCDPETYTKTFNEAMQASALMFASSGSLQLINHLIDECDMLPVNTKLRVDIVKDKPQED